MEKKSQTIELEVLDDSDRLDSWLSQELTDISRSRLQKLIETGNIKLNNNPCTEKKSPLKSGDKITVTIPEPTKLDLLPENIPLDIIYEDEDLIIVNKQANFVVHPGIGHPDGTLVNALLYHCQNLAGIGGVERPGIVHRLDKDTTGAMVVSKSDRAHRDLQAQIQAKTAYREYSAIVYGSPPEDKGTIDLPIGRHKKYRRKKAIIPEDKGGKKAVTHWEIIERIGNYTLMKFILETGRTHQIRVHSSERGYPIVGDPLYSSNNSIGVNLQGQALHARKLILQHPVSGERIEAIAPFPEEFNKLLTVLRKRN